MSGGGDDVEAAAAYHAIHQVLMRYCRGVDRGDVALLRSVYHEGAVDRHGRFDGPGAEFAEYIVSAMDAVGGVGQHHITNVLVDLHGDEADVESYFLAAHPVPGPDGQPVLTLTGGRYLDRFARRGGRWAITERTVVFDWTRATIEGRPWAAAAAFPGGARGDADPSAAFFATRRT